MIPNLRDVGETVNIIHGKEIMNEGMLFRGGTVNELFGETELPPVNTVMNLRTGKDREFESKRQIHIPAVDSVENYQTSNAKVRSWANRVVTSVCSQDGFPILVHCTAGKDRTGVIVALILRALGVKEQIIIEEYMQTDGLKTDKNIRIALNGFGEINEYLYQSELIDVLNSQLTIK